MLHRVCALANQIVLLNMIKVKELMEWMVDHLRFEDTNCSFGKEGVAERRRRRRW